MVSFLDLVKPIVVPLIKSGAKKGVDMTRETMPELNLKDKPTMDAEIESFFGNDIPKLLMYVKKTMEENVAKIGKDFHQSLLKAELSRDFKDVEKCLNAAQTAFERYADNPSEERLNDFTAKSTELKEELDWLFTLITKEWTIRNKFLDDLVLVQNRDIDQFKAWQQAICFAFAQAYTLMSTLLYYTTFPAKSRISLENGEGLIREILPSDSVQNDLMSMQSQSKRLTEEMDKKYKQVKVNFVLKPCGDSRHASCGGNNDNCCELGARIYNILCKGQEEEKDLTAHAKEIASDLQERYKQFDWSVVVFGDHNQMEPLINLVHYKNVWFQRYVETTHRFRDSVRDNVIMINSFGQYGCFLCYHTDHSSSRSALVFWAEPELVGSEDYRVPCERLKEQWNEDNDSADTRTNKKNGAQNVYDVLQSLREKEMDYVFGFGFRGSQKDNGFGTALACDGKFPMLVGGTASFVLIWPDSYQPKTSFNYPVKPKQLSDSNLVSKTYNKFKVYKAHPQDALEGIAAIDIAVKEIALADEPRPRKMQKTTLEVNLEYYRKLEHPNIVHYLGMQEITRSEGLRNVWVFQIVMELCKGGSLTERLKKLADIHSPPDKNQIIQWGTEILEGLKYLHDAGIAHRGICGDHLLFEGPTKGEGKIKIVSVGRIRQMVQNPKRSHVPDSPEDIEASKPYQSPDFITSGTVKDIWSFGCVLLLMINGSLKSSDLEEILITADLDPEIRVMRPKIPERLTNDMKEIILSCFNLNHEEKLTAKNILQKLAEFKQENIPLYRSN